MKKTLIYTLLWILIILGHFLVIDYHTEQNKAFRAFDDCKNFASDVLERNVDYVIEEKREGGNLHLFAFTDTSVSNNSFSFVSEAGFEVGYSYSKTKKMKNFDSTVVVFDDSLFYHMMSLAEAQEEGLEAKILKGDSLNYFWKGLISHSKLIPIAFYDTANFILQITEESKKKRAAMIHEKLWEAARDEVKNFTLQELDELVLEDLNKSKDTSGR